MLNNYKETENNNRKMQIYKEEHHDYKETQLQSNFKTTTETQLYRDLKRQRGAQ